MKIRYFAFFLILLVSCNSNSVKNSLDAENLKGKVKSFKEYWSDKKDDKGKLIKSIANCSFFNVKGFITESQEYGANGKVVEKVNYNYDENDRLISKQASSGDGDLKWRLEYSYHEKDSIAAMSLLGSDGSVLNSTNYRYVDGEILNPMKETKFQFGENYYDNKGCLIEMKMVDNQFSIKYSYSDKLLTEVAFFDNNKQLKSKDTYKYDSKNNLTEKRNVLSSGKLSGLSEYQYLFDEKGNWTTKKELSNHKLTSISERVFEYY
jgi:hypothetical protein